MQPDIGTRVRVLFDDRGLARITAIEDDSYEVTYEPGQRGSGSEWMIPCPAGVADLAEGDFVIEEAA